MRCRLQTRCASAGWCRDARATSRAGRMAGGAGLLWAGLVLLQVLGAPSHAAFLFDLQATARGGARAWEAAHAWGLRCRWRGPVREPQRISDACGPAALCEVLRQRGFDTTQELLWSMCRVPGGGTTLGRLAGAARCFGRPCEARLCPHFDAIPLPAIVHLRQRHFVVLQHLEARRAEVLDPACGRIAVPASRLVALASGAVLIFPVQAAAALRAPEAARAATAARPAAPRVEASAP